MAIVFHTVDLGSEKIKIPVAEFNKEFTRKIIITAGMDGDEYSGIQAAYNLISGIEPGKIPFHLVIIPVVNIPGFYAGISNNPQDGKYPKEIFPGKKKGSSTERLMHWFSTTILPGSFLWLDLHSGASHELLNPFIWSFQTGNRDINADTTRLLALFPKNTLLYTRSSYANSIAKYGCSYLVFEAGESGQRESYTIHIQWVRKILKKLALHRISPTQADIRLFRRLNYLKGDREGIWVYHHPGINSIRRGEQLGSIMSLEGKNIRKIEAPKDGVLLWMKEDMYCRKGELLFVLATDSSQFRVKTLA